jgi:hypothetical protein
MGALDDGELGTAVAEEPSALTVQTAQIAHAAVAITIPDLANCCPPPAAPAACETLTAIAASYGVHVSMISRLEP